MENHLAPGPQEADIQHGADAPSRLQNPRLPGQFLRAVDPDIRNLIPDSLHQIIPHLRHSPDVIQEILLGQAAGFPEARDPRHILRAGAHALLLASADDKSRQVNVLPTVHGAHAHRPVHLVGADSQKIHIQIPKIRLPVGLHRICVHQNPVIILPAASLRRLHLHIIAAARPHIDPALTRIVGVVLLRPERIPGLRIHFRPGAGRFPITVGDLCDLPHRHHRPDLVIHTHHRNQNRIVINLPGQLPHVQPALIVHIQIGDAESLLLQVLARLQHRRMLHPGGDNLLSPMPAAVGRPVEHCVIPFRTAGIKKHLLRPHADGIRKNLPGRGDPLLRPDPQIVQRGRISEIHPAHFRNEIRHLIRLPGRGTIIKVNKWLVCHLRKPPVSTYFHLPVRYVRSNVLPAMAMAHETSYLYRSVTFDPMFCRPGQWPTKRCVTIHSQKVILPHDVVHSVNTGVRS